MKVGQSQNNLGFSAVTPDSKKLAKLGPKFATILKETLPEIEKRSGGVNVILTADINNNQKWLKVISKTKKSVGGFLGLGAKKGESLSLTRFLDADAIITLVKNNVRDAKRNLREKFEKKYGHPVYQNGGYSERAAAREERKAAKILSKIEWPHSEKKPAKYDEHYVDGAL